MLKTKIYQDDGFIKVSVFYLALNMMLKLFGKKIAFIGNINTHKIIKVLIESK